MSTKRRKQRAARRRSTDASSSPSEPPQSARSSWFAIRSVWASVPVVIAILVGWYFNKSRHETQQTDSASQTQVSQTFGSSTRNELREVAAQLPDSRQSDWQLWDDLSSDGWRIEEFHTLAKKQFKQLGKLLTETPEQLDDVHLKPLVTEDLVWDPLVPPQAATVLNDGHLTIRRYSPPADDVPVDGVPADKVALRQGGSADFIAELRLLAKDFDHVQPPQWHTKVFNVVPSPDGVTTRQYFELSGTTSSGFVEYHWTTTVDWTEVDPAHPRIRSIKVDAFEQTVLDSSKGTMYTDCTQSVFGEDPTYHRQIALGYEHWLGKMQEQRYWYVLATPGIAIGDVNGDGFEDLYVCQETGLPNCLFIQNEDGSVTERAAGWNVDFLRWSRSALLVDLDNDGDSDLAVAMLGAVVLAENVDQQRFEVRKILPCSEDTTSLTAVDYDTDGNLDLYVCAYYADARPEDVSGSTTATDSSDFVFHDANTGGPNSLFRNDIQGDEEWNFTDVTDQVGLSENNQRFSLAAAWEDYDNDGDADLYVANDFGRNNLYDNDGSAGTVRFVDAAPAAGAEDRAGGMAVTWADFDRDGWLDIHISNMFSSAGNRITFQPEFGTDVSSDVREGVQRFARGDTLLRNLGNTEDAGRVVFEDASLSAGITMGRWAWSSHACDINNDGWEDILVANGYITTENTGDL